MELRDFAEQILFATTLDGKLQCPEGITDVHPGSSLRAPPAPGRPVELRFKAQGAGPADFPGVHRLERASERGRLLHFFANHELLATELMALVLLRFPDAPAAFRRGVLQTLQDEQLHTRLYLERMAECGVRFGDLPVSGYFWRAVSPMETPMDYVAGLSLTFEQANLDFCRHFARGFEAVGDAGTARLLERIYRDEIGHVASGLKWFRRWKNPRESDWEAFCRQLKFPLSPSRAKGIMLNVEGRRAAGLDTGFIAELNVHSQSKGRTPGVFVFNPFTEGRLALGKQFTPVKRQALLAADLANLPQFLCRQDDIVLVPRRPSVQFLSAIKDAGFPLPEFVELQRGTIDASGSVARRKLGRLRPWAWGPDSMELLKPLRANVTGEEETPKPRFHEGIAELYSKAWSAAFLRKMLHRCGLESWLCSEREVGVSADTLAGALDAVEGIRRRGNHKVVVKESFGLAGRNMIRLWEPQILEKQRRWMANALKNNRPLVIEPWLEREMDFSIQLEMEPGGPQLCGYTGLINDRTGQFQANWATANAARRLPAQVMALFRQPRDIADQIHGFYRKVIAALSDELAQIGYRGPVGIDAFIYRAPDGDCRLKPIVEINPRYTMGRLTLELMKRTCPGCSGLFRIVSLSQVRSEGFPGLEDYARSMSARFPLGFDGMPVSRICEGALCLNDPSQSQVCLAVFQVGRRLDELVSVGSSTLSVGHPYAEEKQMQQSNYVIVNQK